jgi:lipoyl(octanoyl) transferase
MATRGPTSAGRDPAGSGTPNELWTTWLGTVEYREAYALQERVRAARQAGAIPDTLLLLEHPPVYTTTRRTGAADLPMGEQWYRSQGFDIIEADRGGRVTYHGPGQLTGYTIMGATDVVGFVRTLEQALVAALADEGLAAHARPDDGPDYTGVWIEERKVASLGVHVQKGVTTHGFAVNVQNDLQPFEWVVACGLPAVRMTSVLKEQRGGGELLPCFRKRAAHRVAEAYGLRQRIVTPARLQRALAPAYSSA